MNQVIREYGSMIIGVLGTMVILALFRYSIFDADGALARLITVWGNGGF